MADISVDVLADEMYKLVVDTYGKKNLKSMDLHKAMKQKFGKDACPKANLKKAVRQLIDSGKCQYSYVGGSYVVPTQEVK